MQTISFPDAASMRVAMQPLSFDDRSRCVATPSESGYDLAVPDDLMGSVQSVNVPAALLEDRRARKLAAINAKRDALIGAGYRHNFGASAGWRTLDQRHVGDETAWLSVKLRASDLIAAGDGSQIIRMRDAANQCFLTSAETADAAMSAMGVWRADISGHSWDLKDAVEAAEDAAAIDAIDIEAGWPGD